MFAGVDYEIDLSQPKGARIKNVMFKGKPLTDEQTLHPGSVTTTATLPPSSPRGLWRQEGSGSPPTPSGDMIVAYFAEHSPVAPEVDHNWKITGVDLQKDNPDRATLIELVNTGRLESPYSQSLNLDTYSECLAWWTM